MKTNVYLEKSIDILNLNYDLINKLKKLQIYNIQDLCKCKRDYLKDNDFSNNDINQIKIKLQLIGLDLNKKNYTS